MKDIIIIILCIVAGIILIFALFCMFMYWLFHSASKQFSVESSIAHAKKFLGFDIGDAFEVVWNKNRPFPPQMKIALKCTDEKKWNDIVSFCKEQKEYERRKKLPDGYCVFMCTKQTATSIYITPSGGRASYTCNFEKIEDGYHKGHAEGDCESVKICYEERLIIYYRV